MKKHLFILPNLDPALQRLRKWQRLHPKAIIYHLADSQDSGHTLCGKRIPRPRQPLYAADGFDPQSIFACQDCYRRDPSNDLRTDSISASATE